METQTYKLGSPRVPPWAGDVLMSIQYDESGNICKASMQTESGVKNLSKGDILIRVNENYVHCLKKKDAIKYGVMTIEE